MVNELFGHRGAAGEAPENTLSGFAYAWSVGVRSFEFDVRLSADHKLFVLHDETLDRTTDQMGKAKERTVKELTQIKVLRLFPNWPEIATIPLLEDVLSSYAGKLLSWQIEIKTDHPERLDILCPLLVEQVRRFELDEVVTITSFDPYPLAKMCQLAPDLRRGFISSYAEGSEDLKLAGELGCWNACIPLARSTKNMVNEAHRLGFNVTGWLGNTPADLDQLMDWNVDSITSNYPSLALPYLREHGCTIFG